MPISSRSSRDPMTECADVLNRANGALRSMSNKALKILSIIFRRYSQDDPLHLLRYPSRSCRQTIDTSCAGQVRYRGRNRSRFSASICKLVDPIELR